MPLPEHETLMQSSSFVAQSAPVNPARHRHENAAIPSTQVPLFWQGAEAQSSTFSSQFVPAKPVTQVQVKLLSLSVQVPLFMQG